MDCRLHPLHSSTPEPQRFTYPFNYIPHPLCTLAATEVQQWIMAERLVSEEVEQGKMFGVLVVKDREGRLGYLAAYSGLLGGRNDWPFFVPPVFDNQQEDGFFKLKEREISLINNRIDAMKNSKRIMVLRQRYTEDKKIQEEGIEKFKALMRSSKAKRHEMRNSAIPPTNEELAAAVAESQYQKAELRRMKVRAAEKLAPMSKELDEYAEKINELKNRRREMSDKLQQWLFSQYDILNANGEHTDLFSIFSNTPQRVPPSGAGDCCAPKLLQYAFLKGYHAVCMAEFWWGKSPKAEIRHHLHYYPACHSKCKPILGFMLQGLNVDENPHNSAKGESEEEKLRIVYEDNDIVVVSKPAGMLSVPGLVGKDSVVDILQRKRGKDSFTVAAHRLDMDTSGLLVVAKNEEALRGLHKQFENREVKKQYSAILDGMPDCAASGAISLPLAPDPHDRPRQIVSSAGKKAETRYEILRSEGGKTFVSLQPLTGRTHQLRIHCAHHDGLGVPILGDKLYGHPTIGRMFLHAARITFKHPKTGESLTFSDPAPWYEQSKIH